MLAAGRQSLMDQWAANAFMRDTGDQLIIANAAALGAVEVHERLLTLDLEQLNQAIKEEDQDEQADD